MPKKDILKKSIDEMPKSSLLVGGAILAVVVLSLLATLTWYLMRFGKTP